MSAPTLPRWARRGDDGVIEVDPDQAYPVYLALLGIDLDDADQFWAEVARRCLTADLKTLLGTPLAIRIRPSNHWVLAGLPVGGGAALGAATFRTFYARIEGRGLNG
ncbi:MAG TPA: hypothetical protein VES39_01430 [Rhodospirillales bacterium]|nr:hypothetical protein [Rhodospirillales bacterium]